jgi:hypothetical protein
MIASNDIEPALITGDDIIKMNVSNDIKLALITGDDSNSDWEEDSVNSNHSLNSNQSETSSENEYNLLGMKAFKVRNLDERISNLLRVLPPSPIEISDFDDEVRAQLPYKYARSVLRNNSRAVDDKQQIKEWLLTMPPQPLDHDKGFLRGSALRWFRHVYGEEAQSVLPRVLEKAKNPSLRRPDKDYYLDSKVLATDQETMDRLPEEIFFTAVGDSRNAGHYIVILYICYDK